MAIRLIAFDFGSTTSKALEASAQLVRNAVTGRTEIRELETIFRSEPVFTPFLGEKLDEARVHALVDGWLAANPAANPADTVAGGVIVTGLAAKKENAKAIATAVRSRIGEAVVAVADNPGQESWLAFMGSCATLSGAHPRERFLNFDIGGGTTNIALGANKTVESMGSLWVGARHFRFAPGTYRLEGLSPQGGALLADLGLRAQKGAALAAGDAARIADHYTKALETAVSQNPRPADRRKLTGLEQLPFPLVPAGRQPILTFSGGVGELVYRIAKGERFPLTPFGDLGVELATAIVASPVLSRSLLDFVPQNLGRATVCGLAFHGVEASGNTVFLPRPELLPLRDLPLLGRISAGTSRLEMDQLVARAKQLPGGSCLLVGEELADLDQLKEVAAKLSFALRKNRFPKGVPLIIFTPQNLGKTLGHYATEWGRLALDLIVIDEIERDAVEKQAYFASVHRSGAGGKENNLLVSFYGGMDQK
jgi:ethanolamine utilization protein EutA